MLLALVLGVVLVLVGVTASALVAITSDHVANATLSGVVNRDAALVELFVKGTLQAGDIDADGPSRARTADLTAQLSALSDDDGIVRIEIRDLAGRVIVSNDQSVTGRQAGASESSDRAAGGDPIASLVEAGLPLDTAGAVSNPAGMVQEFLPILGADDQPLAVIAMWRDAGDLMARLDATRRDIMLVTLAASVLLAGILFLVFRAAQARLSRQHRQLVESTRRDALTGMFNHGTVVGLLAEEVEAARTSDGRIGVALVDVDNFRLFNDTHGHGAADEVLLRVAALVSASGGDLVARYGPDEFIIVQSGAGSDEVRSAVDRLRTELADESVQFGDSEHLPITVSVGISCYPEHAGSVTDLLSAAAVALAEAKAGGGDAVRVIEAGEESRVVAGSFDVLQGLVIAVDTKDRYTKRHSEDVARYAVFLAQRMGLDEETQHTIQLAGLLHDIGKIGIPDVVLRKPSKLTDDEFEMFKQHVALGDAIVRDVPNVELVRAGIRHHHERWDGDGYLTGLEGEAIPLVGRILAVADAFSAMTTTRPYRKALPITEALKRLGDGAGTQLQEELVVAFITGIETAADAPLPGEEPAQLWRPELWVA